MINDGHITASFGSELPGDPLPPEVQRWLVGLAADYRVLVPSEKSGNRIFEEVSASGTTGLGLPQHRTIGSFKKTFLPPAETLLSFNAGAMSAAPPMEKTVIFGMHICELSADRLLTDVMKYDCPDYPYVTRRQRALTIGVPCRRTDNCFCEKTGHNRAGPGSFDLFLNVPPGGDEGGLELIAGSKAGVALAKAAPMPLKKTPGTHPASPAGSASQKSPGVLAAPPPGDMAHKGQWPLAELPERIRSSFGAVMWDELADRCLGCGNCTIVCPLCYCFFTRDETGLDPAKGQRARHWDSCQLVAFARVAGGHNFREARAERIWYRFSHKFMRMQEAFGRPGCTGCGACFHFCPADIDPRAVIESVLAVTADE